MRPEAVGLCGSDFHYFHGHLAGVAYPRVQGHEFSAIVEAVGDGCPADFAPGQRVAVWPLSACGACHACAIGRENACERMSLIGIHSDGALQERLTVPAAQSFAVDDLDARLTAFIEPTSIAVRTVVRGRVAAGEHVLVLGAGPIGQAVAIASLDRGAVVLVADRIESRLEFARAYGCEVAVMAPGEDIAARARAWAGGQAPEVVVEATGAAEPMRLALAPSHRRAASSSSRSRGTRCRCASATWRSASSTCSASACARPPSSRRRRRSSSAGSTPSRRCSPTISRSRTRPRRSPTRAGIQPRS